MKGKETSWKVITPWKFSYTNENPITFGKLDLNLREMYNILVCEHWAKCSIMFLGE